MEQSVRPAAPSSRPVSDVSGAVGLVGIAGLAVWILICRNWPGIVDLLGLPGPHARLSGPYAALAALAFSSIPMVIWSVVVDKVHRNPSTGIDWGNVRPQSETIDISITKLAGLWATWALIGFLYCVGRWYWRGQYVFAMEVIGAAAVPAFLLSIPYVLWLDRRMVNPRDASWHFGAMLIGREPYDLEQVWKHLRIWAVKGFFTAFMVSILPWSFTNLVELDPATIARQPAAMANALINAMFFFDVQIGAVGYIMTFKPVDAHIRSANPFLAGWLAALLCYPPFVVMSSQALSYEVNTADWSHWMQGHIALQWVWCALLTFLTGVYASATVIFGLRFSNLTYRGVVTTGPYRFTRHPAYLSKNLFWWCSSLPFLVTSHSLTDAIRNTFFILVTNAIYFWRAKTEEKHLLAEDPKYREYHAWMAENALITRSFRKIAALARPRGPRLQPAE